MLVELKNIRKAFGGVLALDGVNFAIEKGGLHGLLGENGAGKTTLMNILYGYYRMDSGEILLDGRKAGIHSPHDAIRHGIGMVHQLSTLVPEFTAAENIILGTGMSRPSLRALAKQSRSLPRAKHWIATAFGLPPNHRRTSAMTAEQTLLIQTLCDELGLSFPLHTKVKGLSAGIKQKIEIVRALYRGAKLIIMDEPTTFLVESEFEQLLKSVKKLIEQGITVIFITHKIREVMKACDTVTVLRRGKVEGTIGRSEMEREKLVKMMFVEKDISITESALPNVELPSAPRSGEPFLSLKNLSVTAGKKGVGVHKISFDLYGGEIMGIASVSGNGVKELVAALIDPSHIKEGDVLINCRGISKIVPPPLKKGDRGGFYNKSPLTPLFQSGGITQSDSIRGLSTLQVFERGVFFTPEERINEGILADGTIKENILLGHHDEKRFLRHKFFIDWDEAGRAARKAIKEYAIQTPDEETPVKRLSGGNIQKVIIGRAFVDPISLLITHNPTVGLDISSVEFIFRKLVEMRNRGDAVLWANDDLDELMMLCDRIAVIYRGGLKGIFERRQFDKYQIGLAMIGACCTS